SPLPSPFAGKRQRRRTEKRGATGRILVNLLKKINLLPPDCRFTLMKQDLWHEDVNIDNGLDYLNNLKILKDKK
ncbi:MAG: hypothetical protein ACFFCU_00005, partial [Promethearchaeota archaeon]